MTYLLKFTRGAGVFALEEYRIETAERMIAGARYCRRGIF